MTEINEIPATTAAPEAPEAQPAKKPTRTRTTKAKTTATKTTVPRTRKKAAAKKSDEPVATATIAPTAAPANDELFPQTQTTTPPTSESAPKPTPQTASREPVAAEKTAEQNPPTSAISETPAPANREPSAAPTAATNVADPTANDEPVTANHNGEDRTNENNRESRNRGRETNEVNQKRSFNGKKRYPKYVARNESHAQQPANGDPGNASAQPTNSEPARPPAPPEYAEGIVEVSGKGFGFLRESKRGYMQSPQDTFVTPEIVRNFNLRDGLWLKGETRRGNRGLQLYKLTEINGESPEKYRNIVPFEDLTTINPLERIRLETVSDRYTTRIMDMMTPVGKGQRGLIVAPPRTGKTTLLQHIADAVVKNHPEMKLIIMLIDERPEEVTEIRRTVPTAELMASSNDSDIKSHTRIAQLAIERAKRLVEAGHDVFILLDSITRLGRAFNNATGGGGRTMSGGIDSRALEIPRKLFAAARNTEEAGSLTIVATALIETGSKMDELIFQEFKGTGNMEMVLDRKISDLRIYPAVDIFQSGTRREELLIPADQLHKINVIRRGLAGHRPAEAIERLLSFVRKFETNEQLLREIPG